MQMQPIATDGVAYSVSRSVTIVSHAKMAESTEMPFALWTLMGPNNHVLDRGPNLHTLRGNFESEKGPI